MDSDGKINVLLKDEDTGDRIMLKMHPGMLWEKATFVKMPDGSSRGILDYGLQHDGSHLIPMIIVGSDPAKKPTGEVEFV